MAPSLNRRTRWPGSRAAWLRVAAALWLPCLAALLVQALQQPAPAALGVHVWRSARVLLSNATEPPAELGSAAEHALPLSLPAASGQGAWLDMELPPSTRDLDRLSLDFKPGLEVWLDGRLVGRSGDSGAETSNRLVLGRTHWALDLPAALRPAGASHLQLRLAAPGPSGARLLAPLLGPPAAVIALDEGRRDWQGLRAATALGGLLVALFLLMVARLRRDDPLYLPSAVHVGLLALLLSPYVLAEQPLPSPAWRMLLDAADLVAKALLVVITARLGGGLRPQLKRALTVLLAIGLPIDLLAAARGWSWADFHHPWAWWALGSRAALLGVAWALALRALGRQGRLGDWATALLVGFSATTWASVSLGALVFDVPVVDSNALAHAGWVAWVTLMLLRHFTDAARREQMLRQQLATDLATRTQELQAAFEARAQAERERASSEQRRRLLQDLHDGLGARLLGVRLRLGELDGPALAQALDDCLLEMRLSVDTLADDEGDLGVLLGSWRRRVDALVQAAGLTLVWRVQPSPALPCLQGAGALELVRGLGELLSNCIRHAGARHLLVATEVCDEDVTLWLVDDGCGLAPERPPSQGQRSLAERARRLGGHIDWMSPAPSHWGLAAPGTAVAWRLPLRPAGRGAEPPAPPASWSAPAASGSSA